MLQDVIVLRIEKSIDHYVHVKAEYERSCYGMSLEDLVQIVEPVSSVPLPAINPESFLSDMTANNAPDSLLLSTNNAANDSKLSIPKELWRLVDALWTSNALKEKDLFNSAYANADEVQMIRQALDRGLDFGPCSPHSLVEALVSFFAALPRPLLPIDLYPNVSEFLRCSMDC